MKKCRKIAGVLVVVMIAVLTMAACGSDTQDVEPADKRSSAGFEDFEGELLGGGVVTEDIFAKADLTMVNVWATFCGPCLKEMPELGELNSEYADQKFQVVGIVSDVLNQDGTLNQNQIDTAREIVSSTSADYLHLLPTADLLPIVAQAYAVPMTFFVDKDGNLVGEGAYMGAQDKAGWSKIIDAMLEEVAA